MSELRVIEVHQDITAANDREADGLRRAMKAQGTFLLNLMGSPGCGKTTTLLRTLNDLSSECSIGVMEADIDSTVDAEKISAAGARAIQLHTGGLCHMDAGMVAQGLAEFDTRDLDLLVLENIGNLVCTAEFDTGAVRNVAILSVPEGDDKPLKYPLMFSICDVILVNKIDTLPVFEFDLEAFSERVRRLRPGVTILPVSAKTGEGFDAWTDWLRTQIADWKK